MTSSIGWRSSRKTKGCAVKHKGATDLHTTDNAQYNSIMIRRRFIGLLLLTVGIMSNALPYYFALISCLIVLAGGLILIDSMNH